MLGAKRRGLVNAEAAKLGPIVLLTVPFRAQSENLTNLKHVLEAGQILVDATVPLAAAVSGQGHAAARRAAGLGRASRPRRWSPRA